MNRLQQWLLRGVTFLAATVGQWCQLYAQGAGDEPETQEAWVISYALVIFSVGLGLFVICRPTRRNKKVKTEK